MNGAKNNFYYSLISPFTFSRLSQISSNSMMTEQSSVLPEMFFTFTIRTSTPFRSKKSTAKTSPGKAEL